MPIPLPSLDDHDFDDLVQEARALVPVLLPEWTDHNPGDPGIVLVELLAWLTEMQLYQVDQLSPSHTLAFLRLLGGPRWTPPDGGDLDTAVRRSVAVLHERHRAATADDYEYLVRATWPGQPEAAGLPGIRRVRCVPGRDLAGADPAAAAPAHVSVVVVPEPAGPADTHPLPPETLTAALHEFLEPRRILTVRHHVVGPEYADIGISADLALREDAVPEEALADARDRLRAYCDPLTGGRSGDGRPFGQSVYVSEVYTVLEQAPLVDYIENVRLTPAVTGGAIGAAPDAAGLTLDAHQLVRLARVDLTGYDSYGRAHPSTWELPE
ncbi:baseplate J/gp47 family protein [Streptomyces sp. NPDC047000]|uniref:baseplate J/gp47 family protein n=1 Tax=Streptomyces sp. NPDC047000 TaxID=3155474 RepID=UPI0033E28365